MKKLTFILFIITSLLLASCVSNPNGNESSESFVSNNESISDISIDKETHGTPLEGRFGEYSFADEQDGYKIITLYSWEQISDFQARRRNGEWFSLTSDNIKFLIDDTRDLFDDYDIIKVRSIDGKISTYYGTNFYLSEDYYNSFNGFNSENLDYSFDFKYDLYDAIYKRIEVLNSAMIRHEGIGNINALAVANADYMSQNELEQLLKYYEQVYVMGGKSDKFAHLNVDALYFDLAGQDKILEYVEDISKGKQSVITRLFCDDAFISNTIGQYKYDKLEKNVVIELWNEESQAMIARIRIDEKHSPEEFSEILSKAKEITVGPSEMYPPTTNYRVGVYFNGVTVSDWENFSFKYYPDGNIEQYALLAGAPMFSPDAMGDHWLGMESCQALSEYINKLLTLHLSSND